MFNVKMQNVWNNTWTTHVLTMIWHAGDRNRPCQNVNGMIGIVGMIQSRWNLFVGTKLVINVFHITSEGLAIMMIKIAGDKYCCFLIHNVRKIQIALSNFIFCQLVKMMI